MRVVLIAAVAENGVIGADGEMPWHYPEDLAHFRRTTVGHPVVVGRRTFERIRADLGGPLPDRENVVLTHRPGSLPPGVTGVGSPAAALAAAAETGAETVYVAGGASVYGQFLPRVDELLVSELPEAVPGDTHFPEVAWDRWAEAGRDRHGEFDVVRYVRREEVGDG